MKKRNLLILLLCALGMGIMASPSGIFSYNKQEVGSEMNNLVRLEQIVADQPGVDLETLQMSHPELTENFVGDASEILGGTGYGDPLGIELIYYGCLLLISLVGFIYFIYVAATW